MKRTMVIAMLAVVVIGGCDDGKSKVLVAPGPALTATRGEAPAVMVAKGPAIDGTLSSPLWAKCPALEIKAIEKGDTLDATARVLLDGKNIYVAVECVEADTDGMAAEAVDRDDAVWQDDNIELFVEGNPDVGRVHVAVNTRGVIADGRAGPNAGEDSSWDSSAVVKTRIEKNKRWIVTMSIPLTDLGVVSGANQTWLMNIYRTKPIDGDFIEASWSAAGNDDYHDVSTWGKLTGVSIP